MCLGIAQLQWALSFLKGVKNSKGSHPKDVAICMQAIEDELIAGYAEMVDCVKPKGRKEKINGMQSKSETIGMDTSTQVGTYIITFLATDTLNLSLGQRRRINIVQQCEKGFRRHDYKNNSVFDQLCGNVWKNSNTFPRPIPSQAGLYGGRLENERGALKPNPCT